MELGDVDTKVQGVDYAYTLQGWIKGVNSQFLRASMDMGQDSLTVAKDAYAYSLGYYPNDYKPIGGSTSYPAFKYQYTQSGGDITGQSLYNGNISTSSLAIDSINANTPVGYTYHYDQLNRLIHLRQHNDITSWNGNSSSINKGYQEDFSYDGNGNILTLRRTAIDSTHIDTFKYQYNRDVNGNLSDNKLNWLKGKGTATYTGTLQAANNYSYDPIGNMTADRQDSISNVTWSVYGKIQSITDTDKTIAYNYNTSQERVSKTANSLTTYYVRDAQGNTVALYDNATGDINWREQHLYGSSRLGMWLPNINISSGGALAKWDTIGHKDYELDNHLGNVIATISDARTIASGYYKPIINTSQDYYSFGALMPGRTLLTQDYRYGFNGKENDNEVKGIGNQQDYGSRIYDPRMGRFLSVDPISRKYPSLTPYQFAGNAPIDGIDQDGLEWKKFDKSNSSTIIFPKDYENDDVIGPEYKVAEKAHMNIVIAGSLNDLYQLLYEKKTSYQNLLFAGHGTGYISTLRLGSDIYDAKALNNNVVILRDISYFIKPKGSIILLACFQSTPPSSDPKDKNWPTMNGQALTKMLSSYTNTNVIANPAETDVTSDMFSGNRPLAELTYGTGTYARLNDKFSGQWSLTQPDGTIRLLGPISITPTGDYKLSPKKPKPENPKPKKTKPDSKNAKPDSKNAKTTL